MSTELFIIVSGLAGLLWSGFLVRSVLKKPPGSQKIQAISQAIREGANAYLKRQYLTMLAVAIPLAAIIFFGFNLTTALGFLLGGFLSGLAGYIGMNVAVRANVRVTEAARHGIKEAFGIAFRGGSVTGFLVVSLALLAVASFYFITGNLIALVGLGFGGSLISIFARLGGGIYTKGADVGADLVGKIELGIPEDDPRNPAVIADNVGDNVGDVAGMAADLFETYAIAIIAAMLLGSLVEGGFFVILPLAIGAIAILASILGSLFVRLGSNVKKESQIMMAFYKGLAASAILALAGFYVFLKNSATPANFVWPIFFSLLVGILVVALIVVITEYYTAKRFRPVRSIASSTQTGHATTIITGLAFSMEAAVLPAIVIIAGIIFSFVFMGIYGLALAVTSMLAMTGIIVAIDSFGPITDNAGGIAQMANLEKEVREVTDTLDAVGNTTKAVTKGYAIASAGLAGLVLFAAYVSEIINRGFVISFDLAQPLVLVGLFAGGVVTYLFSAISMRAVSKAAGSIVKEVRRQFKEHPGIMDYTDKPDYARAVDIVTVSAQREMIIPALIPVLAPIIVGFLFGPQALGGLLIGSIITGLFMAVSMTSGGAAWDNAKKFIEEGNFGGKGSPAHQAAVTGDTVGDPYKDTTGPAINPMIKVINIVALLIIGFIL